MRAGTVLDKVEIEEEEEAPPPARDKTELNEDVFLASDTGEDDEGGGWLWEWNEKGDIQDDKEFNAEMAPLASPVATAERRARCWTRREREWGGLRCETEGERKGSGNTPVPTKADTN